MSRFHQILNYCSVTKKQCKAQINYTHRCCLLSRSWLKTHFDMQRGDDECGVNPHINWLYSYVLLIKPKLTKTPLWYAKRWWVCAEDPHINRICSHVLLIEPKLTKIPLWYAKRRWVCSGPAQKSTLLIRIRNWAEID